MKFWYYQSERSWWNNIHKKKIKVQKSKDTLINQIYHFANVAMKKEKPKVTGKDGLNSLIIFDAINKSSKSGKKIQII